MREVFFNPDNLRKDKIDEVAVRAKALIINSNNEITLGYSNKSYQFPGGHLEKDESLEECLIREVKEELGMDIKGLVLEPFCKIIYYNKNYRGTSKNRENDIYYYIIKTDLKCDISNCNLDEGEVAGGYSIEVIPLDLVEDVLIKSIPDNSINKIIVDEMLTVLEEFKKIESYQ